MPCPNRFEWGGCCSVVRKREDFYGVHTARLERQYTLWSGKYKKTSHGYDCDCKEVRSKWTQLPDQFTAILITDYIQNGWILSPRCCSLTYQEVSRNSSIIWKIIQAACAASWQTLALWTSLCNRIALGQYWSNWYYSFPKKNYKRCKSH